MSFIKSSALLAFTRLSNQAVMFIGPIILVRLISVHDYGVYREFFIYANIACMIGCFAVNRSLLYMLPKHPGAERALINQSTLYVLLSSSLVGLTLFALDGQTAVFDDFEYMPHVIAYLMLFLNVDYVENLWLAKNKVRSIVAYVLTRSLARLLVVLLCALYFKNVDSMIIGLILVELVRLIFVAGYALSSGLSKSDAPAISKPLMREQAVFFLPLALISSLEVINTNLGQLIVSTELGTEYLAYYFVGSYAVLISNLVYGSVSDVLFPEVVRNQSGDIRNKLEPWREMTNFYWILMPAVCAIGILHAEIIVTTLFSESYLPAVPVFQLLILVSLIQCFDFNFVFRMLNKNMNSVLGYLVLIPVNLAVSYYLIGTMGIIAPAIAFLLAQLCLSILLLTRVLRTTGLSIGTLFDLPELLKASICLIIALPVLIFSSMLMQKGVLASIVSCTVFIIFYALLLHWSKVKLFKLGLEKFQAR